MSPGLFLHVVSAEARKRMSYRVDFWINAVVSLGVQLGISYFIVQAIFRESGREVIGGFSERGMFLYYVAAVFLGKIVRSTEMEFSMSQDVYEGGLTRYILYPAGYPTFKYGQQIGALAPTLLQILLLGAWFPLFLGVPPEVHLSPASVLLCAAAVLVANVLQFLLIWPIQAVAFWADNVWSLMVANRIVSGLLGGLIVPLSLYPDWGRAILEWLPYRYLFAFPVETLLGLLSPGAWGKGMLVAVGWCVVFGVVGRAVWRRGGLRYTGVGI